MKSQELVIRNLEKANNYMNHLHTAILIIKRDIFNKIKFDNLNVGEDHAFYKLRHKNEFKFFSSNLFNFVYINLQN